MINTWKKGNNARELFKKLLEVFVDLSDSEKELLEENAKILGVMDGGR